MTSQILTVDSPVHASDVQPHHDQAHPQSAEAVAVDRQRSRLIEAMKSQYQLDQQVKFLHLQAEADSLLRQLQSLKQQRLALETPISSQ
ncbi:hypothetical protein [Stenomitos frigidus]|uniref:Uncharacterized protein n=1 Tax=Stenomitos frigidus ULC18 TaxID=2107698 RepID=A0A2T1ELN9_9CYAN|nr:hypothetical protein [Stenomitos frigidus]PSB33644.1 hypothetical protein C7B82_03945 [Stenomitos frigidus ULC18]